MVELSSKQHGCLKQLCNSKKEDVVLWGFIEGNDGIGWVDNITDPKQAVIIVADFCYLIGTTNNPIELKYIVTKYSKNKIIMIEDSNWIKFLEEYFKGKYTSFKRYSTKKETNIFDKVVLKNNVSSLDEKYTIKKINQSIYYEVLKIQWAANACCYFKSVEDFMNHGIGYVIYDNNQIISIASSYAYCPDNIALTVATLEDYRRKGLALACTSRLIQDCMEKRIHPKWEVVNMTCVSLAEKLGYHFEEAFDVYTISD